MHSGKSRTRYMKMDRATQAREIVREPIGIQA